MPTLRMLGRIRLEADDGAEIAELQRQPKRLALLAYLASPRPGTWHRRDVLLSVFWPELDAARGRTALRSAIYVLRQHLGPEVVRGRGDDELSLDPERFRTDAAALEAAASPADTLAAWQGDLLPGLFIPEAEGFEKWLDGERARLRGLAVRAGRLLVAERERAGDWAGAAAAGLAVLDLEPDDESLVRRVITAFDRAGDHAQALAVFQRFSIRLAAEFEAEPSEETTRLARAIQARRAPASPSLPPPSGGLPLAPATEEQTTPPAEPAAAIPSPARRWAMAALGLAAVALVIFAPWRSGTNEPPAPRALVVLPLENEAGAEFDYVATGLAADVAERLRGLGGLATIRSTGAAAGPIAQQRDVRQVGEAFGVTVAVAGHLTRVADSLQAVTEVVDIATGQRQPLAGVAFGTGNLRDAGSRVAAAVAGALFRRSLPPRDSPDIDPESYRLTREGWHFQDRLDFARSKDLFLRATELDPSNASAWSGLAAAWGALAVSYRVPWEEGWLKANAASLRALALDSLQAPALANLGLYRALSARSLAAGESLVTRAIAMDPGNTGSYLTQQALYRHAWAWDKARDGIRMARQMDPLNPYFVNREALVEICAGRPAEALRLYREELAMDSTRRDAANGVARSLAMQGRWDEALDEWRGFARRNRDSALASLLAGQRGEAGYWQVAETEGRARLAALQQAARTGWVSPSQLAMVTVAAGDLDGGLHMLEEQAETDEVGLYRLPCFAEVDRIRKEPRFQALLKRLAGKGGR